MNLPRNVGLNTAVRTVTSFAEKALVFLVMALIGRKLGASGLGVYSFALSYVVFFRLLTDWGLYPIAIRTLSTSHQERKSEIFGALFTLRVVLVVAAGILAAGAFFVGATVPLVKTAVCIASITLVDVVSEACGTVLQAELKQTWLGILELSNRLLWGCAALATLILGGGILAVLLVLASSSLVQLVSAIWVSRRLLPFTISIDPRLWKKLLGESWPLAAQALMSTVYIRIDQLLLYPIAGVAAVGLYSAGVKLAEVWGLSAGVFQAATFPLMCRFHRVDETKFRRISQLSFRYLFVAMFAVVFCFTVYASKFLALVFGAQFTGASKALVLLIWAEIFLVANMLGGAIMVAAGQEKVVFVLGLAAAGSNVLLNLVLIPRYGFVGAAWASLVSYAMYGVAETMIPRTHAYSRFMWSQIWRPALACLGAVAIFVVFHENRLVLLPAGLVMYFVLLLLFRGLAWEDLAMLRRALAPEPADGLTETRVESADEDFASAADQPLIVQTAVAQRTCGRN